MFHSLLPWVQVVGGFLILALAARPLGKWSTRWHLPLITGYLLAGVLIGPFGFGFIQPAHFDRLHHLSRTALAWIAFTAGGELYLKEIRHDLRHILRVTLALVVFTYLFTIPVWLWIGSYWPMAGVIGPAVQLPVAFFAATILTARSPSSAVAVAQEMRAKGPFTRTALGVTVLTDVVVILFFGLSRAGYDTWTQEGGFRGQDIVWLFLSGGLAILVGFLLGKLLDVVLRRSQQIWIAPTVFLVTGYLTFPASAWLGEWTHHHLGGEIMMEPLLVCMTTGFVLINFGDRDSFRRLWRDITPTVYLIFFTLAGAELDLPILVKGWSVALLLVLVRWFSIYLGSVVGERRQGLTKLSWTAYLTQAGVSLGLAEELAESYPSWGPDFASLMIAVIIINQLIGPPLFRWGLNRSGESRRRKLEGSGGRALILGLENQALALARRLQQADWEVQVLTRREAELGTSTNPAVPVKTVENFDLIALEEAGLKRCRAVVSLLKDEETAELFPLLREAYPQLTLVCRLHDPRRGPCLTELGVPTVEAGTAMLGLLEHLVRAPLSLALALGLEAGEELRDMVVQDPALDGVRIRDLRLPLDTLIVAVHRGNEHIVSHGYTRLRLGDRLTVAGKHQGLEELTLMLGS